jgi:signal transduction histidine kinase
MWVSTEVLAQEVETLAALHERTRIARDMHDSLGHTLTNLQVQLAVAQKLRFCDNEKVLQAVDTAKLLADQCIEDVSYALQTMRQTEFDINQALDSLLEQWKHKQAVKIQWKLDLPQIPLHQSYQIYCIVKEGLINIQKHARASKVDLQAYIANNTIIIELKDNGIGFNTKVRYTGLGLKGMSERALMLGAKLEITANSTGTHIKVKIPL